MPRVQNERRITVDYKFRGKRKDNGEWIYGYYCRWYANVSGKSVLEHRIQVVDEDTFIVQTYVVIPETVGMFTGLKDKNGTEIYEGDILKDASGWVYEVRWDDENGRFLGYHSKPRGDTYVCYVGREPPSEIIGNIHDNSELLEVNNAK
jgi:hypothetical protein